MEALLSLAFDNLSSYDGAKIRKGLRQVEGLLAQICLSRQKSTPAEKRRSVIAPGSALATPKELACLKEDPAFREFFKLQEGFGCNYGQNDLLILSTLDLIQGILLLHPPSRALFAREIYMNLFLDLLDDGNCPAIQCTTLLTLVCALLDHPLNTRTFEELDGLLTVSSLFKLRSTSREVKLKLVEFLYFYLMPETPGLSSAGHPVIALQRSPSKLAGAFGRGNSSNSWDGDRRSKTKTTEEKQALLGRYLNNVEDLVEDLRESAPFGTIGTIA
ncbi:hypothetical protein FGG08_005867 [Glutinoglossum americanum]|uniref:Cell division control protein 14 n=1 Tax=Glutinoglossum americanum TaxID=1670608 RepID=A0A9P8I2F4_9PEZI|nr:hypothetical protein FGG08_005867 [Glutinoglossum americanum]